MKNLKYLFLALVLSFVIVPASFAMQCHSGNLGSDECWTNVMVSPLETTVVEKGTILMYDATASSADLNAFQVKVTTANTDGYKVAGVAQRTIATGDYGLVLVRGQGFLRTIGAVTSGDRLFVSGSTGKGVKGASVDTASVASHDKAIAFALVTSATDATGDAYITVV